MADYLGIRASSVSRIESGASLPSGATLIRIFAKFHDLRERYGAGVVSHAAELEELNRWFPSAPPELQDYVIEAYRNALHIEREADESGDSIALVKKRLARANNIAVSKDEATGGVRGNPARPHRARSSDRHEEDD